MNIRPRQHELAPLAFDDAHCPYNVALLQTARLEQARRIRRTADSDLRKPTSLYHVHVRWRVIVRKDAQLEAAFSMYRRQQ